MPKSVTCCIAYCVYLSQMKAVQQAVPMGGDLAKRTLILPITFIPASHLLSSFSVASTSRANESKLCTFAPHWHRIVPGSTQFNRKVRNFDQLARDVQSQWENARPILNSSTNDCLQLQGAWIQHTVWKNIAFRRKVTKLCLFIATHSTRI